MVTFRECTRGECKNLGFEQVMNDHVSSVRTKIGFGNGRISELKFEMLESAEAEAEKLRFQKESEELDETS